MPPEAKTGFIEGWILDNPWPLAVIIMLMAVVVAVIAVQRDDWRLLKISIGGGAVALVVLAIGIMVETAGESARIQTKRFVQAAVDGQVDDMLDTLDPDATLHVAKVQNPGFPRSNLENALDGLRSRHRIEDNSITVLNSAESPDGAVWVELACMTRTNSTGSWVPSRWILEWHRSDSDEWRIRSITAMKIAGTVPRDAGILR